MSAENSSARGRGRGNSRGGLGKYLRARGRGRGRGRGANFTERLVLEDEESVELDEEEQKELHAKYARRQLGSNADRYEEAEPDPEEEPEPEVDLSSFLARQRNTLEAGESYDNDNTNEKIRSMEGRSGGELGISESNDDDGVDHDLSRLISATRLGKSVESNTRKGNVQVLEWDEHMEAMQRDKKAADAMRDLKTRLQGGSKLKSAANISKDKHALSHRKPAVEADLRGQEKHTEENQEGFLDDLLG